MRLGMPTVNERGLGALLSPHFGSAPYFTLVDVETGEVEVVENEHARHEHGRCRPTASLVGRRLDAVLCRGLGRGAHERLREAGLRVYLTGAMDVADAVAAFREGRVVEAEAEQLCRGHHG